MPKSGLMSLAMRKRISQLMKSKARRKLKVSNKVARPRLLHRR